MSFYKYVVALIIYFVLAGFPGRASQEAFKERTVTVKVVIDQYFVRNFNEIKTKEPVALARLSAASPEDFAKSIFERLSVRFRQFGIRFLPVAVENIFVKERVMLDAEYMRILEQSSCQSAEIIVGLTGVAFISTSPGDDGFVVVVGGANRQTGRLFSQFASWGIVANPKLDIENMFDSLDHEMRHLFGTSHKDEGVLDIAEEKIFLQEGTLAIKKNRLRKFICD
ncbi:MAG: hypothetical protein HYT65_02155, partial [Candidatus Yanofskybacteria bacterium]|nr:hypothetical protein [Candidatus Yanofskybacteria bacterium]